MLQFLIKRILYMIPTLLAISIVAFIIIQLPPGDYLTTLVASLASQGEDIDPAALQALKERYGLGQPIYVQYYKWISGIVLRGDFGQSFAWNMPVKDLIWSRLALTFVLSLSSLLFVWIVAFPIGIYSAVKQYSIGDYIATFLGFIGLATPNFLLALILMYIAFKYFNQSVGGLFSPEYQDAPWSWAKVVDMLSHLWIPVIIIGTAGTAGLIRVMRANLLDELRKPYVVTARAKGLPEWKLLFKYPVRVALNPFISTVGWVLPTLVSGAAITSIVLSLPTTGPLLIRALMSQDMYLAGSFILMLSVLTVIGTLVSDLLLAWLDPRIRLE
ncbi:ABC transporter permease [Litorilinea aerophila]|uniref:ABC transporter permease n=1 Tax=Litorilinea aerophila TaxID=1204385 RepID=A0A540VG06_9CHLR|nr:ABC transporter permease [Litorilinea aerophila]MCC9076706.1 ABC transporter permease [Litorilinea aerophila]OUC06820.1 ABC transporter permease [Litorilinea aerophila]GIV77754.1 MAG: ABC transporter permease [Litorilinea sp.]